MQVTRVNQKYRPPRRDLFEGAHGTLQSGHDLDSISHGSLSPSLLLDGSKPMLAPLHLPSPERAWLNSHVLVVLWRPC